MRGYKEVEVRQGDQSFDAFEDAVPVAVELPRIAESLIGFVHLGGSKRPRERALVQHRGDVGAQDGRVRGEGSGQVAVTLGVGEGQGLLQFLDRLVDRAIGATSAIGAISCTTLSYPCR